MYTVLKPDVSISSTGEKKKRKNGAGFHSKTNFLDGIHPAEQEGDLHLSA